MFKTSCKTYISDEKIFSDSAKSSSAYKNQKISFNRFLNLPETANLPALIACKILLLPKI